MAIFKIIEGFPFENLTPLNRQLNAKISWELSDFQKEIWVCECVNLS